MGLLVQPGTELAHVELQLRRGTQTTTLSALDLAFTATTASQTVTTAGSLPRDASTADCGDALVLHVTHPSGTQSVVSLAVSLDLP